MLHKFDVQRVNIETSFFTELCAITAHISWGSLTQIWLQISRWRTKWRLWNTIMGYNSDIINIETAFFTELCVMTPHISCRSLIQIGLQIPRWRIKWRPYKGMAVSQAFIFHFKWYNLLHFAVCQLLCWAFLLLFLLSKARGPLVQSIWHRWTSRCCSLFKL